MGDNSLVLVALIAVGGFLGYKYISGMKGSSDGTAISSDKTVPADLPPPSAADTAAKTAASSPAAVDSAQKDITSNQTVNNNYYINDFSAKIGPGITISPFNRILLVGFNADKYMHNSRYRRSVNIVIDAIPNKRERDYWDDLTDALDREIKRQKIQDEQRKRVPKPVPKPQPCRQKAMCAMNTHWDDNLCKCVPNTVPMPNTHNDGRLVDGAHSNYSRNTLVNNPGRLFI